MRSHILRRLRDKHSRSADFDRFLVRLEDISLKLCPRERFETEKRTLGDIEYTLERVNFSYPSQRKPEPLWRASLPIPLPIYKQINLISQTQSLIGSLIYEPLTKDQFIALINKKPIPNDGTEVSFDQGENISTMIPYIRGPSKDSVVWRAEKSLERYKEVSEQFETAVNLIEERYATKPSELEKLREHFREKLGLSFARGMVLDERSSAQYKVMEAELKRNADLKRAVKQRAKELKSRMTRY